MFWQRALYDVFSADFVPLDFVLSIKQTVEIRRVKRALGLRSDFALVL